MAFDEELRDRIREQLAGDVAVTEKQMFGGVAFLLAGNMAVGVSKDDLMVRVGPGAAEEALDQPHARVFDMTGRPMKGWVLVAAEGTGTDAELAAWVGRGVAFARSLPPKG